MSAPTDLGSAVTTSPRAVEFSAVRLQAEATTLFAGLADGAAANTAVAVPGAAAALSATAAATAEPCYYPCTIFDKFIYNLPPEIRNVLLPPLMSLAAVIGAVLAPVLLVTSLVFGWPWELGPAAASKSEDQPGPAEAEGPDGGVATTMQAEPDAPVAVAGVPAAEVDGGPAARGRGAEPIAGDAPVEAAAPGPDAPRSAEPRTEQPQNAEPEVSVQDTGAAVAFEPQPADPPAADGADAAVADLTETEMGPPGVSSVPGEVEATEAAAPTEATAVVDEQPTGAATHSATEAAAARSPRAARHSTR
ncbi:MAG: hypothetical protein FGM52_01170 [Mycobacterium sp.]|nr:hypothetical protein [Mycobacterium sp.]